MTLTNYPMTRNILNGVDLTDEEMEVVFNAIGLLKDDDVHCLNLIDNVCRNVRNANKFHLLCVKRLFK